MPVTSKTFYNQLDRMDGVRGNGIAAGGFSNYLRRYGPTIDKKEAKAASRALGTDLTRFFNGRKTVDAGELGRKAGQALNADRKGNVSWNDFSGHAVRAAAKPKNKSAPIVSTTELARVDVPLSPPPAKPVSIFQALGLTPRAE